MNQSIPPDTVFEFASPPDQDGVTENNQPYTRLLALYHHRLGELTGSGKENVVDVQGNLSLQLTGWLYGSTEPYTFAPLWVTQAVRHGAITIGRIPQFNPLSVNPVGIPEIGENEYVYQDMPALLEIPVFARVHTWDYFNDSTGVNFPVFNRFYEPPLYRELSGLGNSLVFRLERRYGEGPRLSPTGFVFMGNRPVANDNIYAVTPQYRGGSLGNNVGRGLFFEGLTLPQNEYFGRHYVNLYYRESHGREHLVHSAPVEIFFPTFGINHPDRGRPNFFGTGISGQYEWFPPGQRDTGYFRPDGQTVPTPNWFAYYYDLLASTYQEFSNIRYVRITNTSEILGFAAYRDDYFSITNNLGEHLSTQAGLRCQLFRRKEDGKIARVDQVTVYGLHAFLAVAAHEWAHQYLYRVGIVTDVPGLDSDGDGVADFWEIIFGLDPDYRQSVENYRHNDQEFLCDVISYHYLLANENAWQYDWADVSLQKGRPVRPFPWWYESSGTNRSLYNDLFTSLDDLLP